LIVRPEQQAEIAGLPLFAAMDEGQRRRILGAAFLQSFPPRLCLFEMGSHADFLHILIDGMVELYMTESDHGRERDATMAIVRPPHSFVVAAVYTEQRYLMSARTLVPSRVLLVPAVLIREVIDEDRALMRFAMREMAVGFRFFVRTLADFRMRQSAERFGNFLLLESIRLGSLEQFRLQMDRRTIASLLGMTAEHLSRAVGTLATHGVLVRGAAVHILNRTALIAFVRPDEFLDG